MKIEVRKMSPMGEVESKNEIELPEGRLVITIGNKEFYVNTKNGNVDMIEPDLKKMQTLFVDNLKY